MTISTSAIGNTVGNVYVSSGNTAITWMSINNYSAGNVLANVYVVPNGDTAGTDNLILTNLDLAANDTYQIYAAGEKLLLGNDDSIQVVANTGASLNAVVSYTTL